MNQRTVIKFYNQYQGARYPFEGTNLNNLFSKLTDYTDDELMEVIANNEGDIYEILSKPFVENYFKIKTLQAQIEEQKKIKIEEEKSNLSLGLIEKALARVMIDEYAPQLSKEIYSNVDEYIKATYGTLEKKIVYSIPSTGKKLEETTHEMFETVLQFILADEPVMLVGPAGTGKNVICKQVAKALDLEFYFSNAVTQEYKLTGFIDANGTYQETQFYKAFKDGGIFMLDEIDASIPEVLIILNAAIANRYFDFPVGKIEAHPDFRIVAAGNTFGHGASYTYVGRNQLDGASLDRFALVEINYSPRIEQSLTDDEELLSFVREFRNECNNAGINHIVSYRAITRLNKLIKSGMDTYTVLKTCLLKNMEQDDVNMVIRKLDGSNKYVKELKEHA